MNRLEALLLIAVVVAGVGGFGVGYAVRPMPIPPTRIVPSTVTMSVALLTCFNDGQQPYLQGTFGFTLASTYWTDVIVSVAYTGSWTGDTNQLVPPNSTTPVVITWGPGTMQDIRVTQCPNVGAVIWLVQLDVRPCPNPPCDPALKPAA